MATTFTLGAVAFSDLSSSDGEKALFIRIGAPKHDVKRFHPPGSRGNLLIFNGRTGADIVCSGRYIGALATILSDFKADRVAWTGAPISIIDDEGTTYQNCTLIDCQRLGDPRAMGRGGGKCFLDFIASFNWDGSEE